jgi:hypothetical protein
MPWKYKGFLGGLGNWIASCSQHRVTKHATAWVFIKLLSNMSCTIIMLTLVCRTVSEARSFDETTVQPPTKSVHSNYGSNPSSRNPNDVSDYLFWHFKIHKTLGMQQLLKEAISICTCWLVTKPAEFDFADNKFMPFSCNIVTMAEELVHMTIFLELQISYQHDPGSNTILLMWVL